jgi:hypothetical protein
MRVEDVPGAARPAAGAKDTTSGGTSPMGVDDHDRGAPASSASKSLEKMEQKAMSKITHCEPVVSSITCTTLFILKLFLPFLQVLYTFAFFFSFWVPLPPCRLECLHFCLESDKALSRNTVPRTTMAPET